MKVGIISDTHGLLRPEVLESLEGCEVILHAGDISRQDILDRLEEIAPVIAVRGNNDWELGHLPVSLDFELGGLRVYMTHINYKLPANLSDYNLVVFGHTHMYEERWEAGTLLLNPGSCGPRRFHQAITMAVAEVGGGDIEVTRIDIPQEETRTLGKTASADLRRQIETVIRETDRGRGPDEIAARRGFDRARTEKIVRLYLTHPGIDAEGIMRKMGF